MTEGQKRAVVYYNDTGNTVSKLIGYIAEENEAGVKLKIDRYLVLIPFSKIIRIEYPEGQQ